MSELETEHNPVLTPGDKDFEKLDDVVFFPVSESKLMTLYILSFGMYGFYWFYKNWKCLQPRMPENISPSLRATFYIFYTHALFQQIYQRTAHLQQKHRFNASKLATFFVSCVVIGTLIDSLSAVSSLLDNLSSRFFDITSLTLFIISVYPLAKVQATANRINNDILGYLNHKYSLLNYLLIALGVTFWMIAVINLLSGPMDLAGALNLIPTR